MNRSWRDAVHEAGERAADRAAQLHDRHVELVYERPATPEGLRRARAALLDARDRAATAHRRSADHHLVAAERHEQTAAVLEGAGDHERAHDHRRAAVRHREAAVVAERKAQADSPAVDPVD